MTHLYDLSKNSTCYSCSIDFNTYWVRLWNDGRGYQVFKLEEVVSNKKDKSLEELKEEIKNRFDNECKIEKKKELIEKQTKIVNRLKDRLEEEQKTLQNAIDRLNDLENNRVEENDLDFNNVDGDKIY